MVKSITLPILKCLRCGHSWVPRNQKLPEVCPKCKRKDWNKPRNRATTKVVKNGGELT